MVTKGNSQPHIRGPMICLFVNSVCAKNFSQFYGSGQTPACFIQFCTDVAEFQAAEKAKEF